MLTPPILPPPYIHKRTPDYCPKCRELEEKIEVCKHCGFEYDSDPTFLNWVLFTVFIVLMIYLVITILTWLGDLDHRSLVEILQGQFQWLTVLRVW